MFYYDIMGDGLECKGEQGTSEVAPKRRRSRLQNVLCVSDKFFFSVLSPRVTGRED